MAGGRSTGKPSRHTRASVIAVALGFALGVLFSYEYTALRIRPLVRALGSEDRRIAAAAAAKLAGSTSHIATRRIVLEYEKIRREEARLRESSPEKARELGRAANRISARLPFIFHDSARTTASALAGFLYRRKLTQKASGPFYRRIIDQWRGKETRPPQYKMDAYDPAVSLVRRCLPFTGDATIGHLRRFAAKGPPGAMERTAEMLSDVGTPAAFDAIVSMFEAEGASRLESRLTFALVSISPDRALRLLTDPGKPLPAVFKGHLLSDLGRWRQEGLLEVAVSALEDDNEKVRLFAVYALGCLGHRAAVAPLVAALSDDDRGVRRSAAAALGKIGDRRAVEPLIEALKSGEYSLQRAAADALGEIGDPRAIEPLAEARHYVPLGLFGDLRAVVPLLSAAIPRRAHYISRDFYKALGELRDRRATKRLVEACFYTDYRSSDVYIALKKIGDPDAVTMLGAILYSASREKREDAAWVLGKLGGPRATEYLARAIHDREMRVRRTVARALGKTGDPAAVDALARALADESADVRRAAAASLGAYDGEEARRALLAALGREDDSVRVAAAISLANLGDQRAQATLIQSSRVDPPSRGLLMALEHLGTPETRAAADAVLARFHRASAPPAIALLIRDKGLDGFAREYRQQLRPTANGRAAWLLLLALERSGDIRIARDLLSHGGLGTIEKDVREWAERHGCIDELEDVLER